MSIKRGATVFKLNLKPKLIIALSTLIIIGALAAMSLYLNRPKADVTSQSTRTIDTAKSTTFIGNGTVTVECAGNNKSNFIVTGKINSGSSTNIKYVLSSNRLIKLKVKGSTSAMTSLKKGDSTTISENFNSEFTKALTSCKAGYTGNGAITVKATDGKVKVTLQGMVPVEDTPPVETPPAEEPVASPPATTPPTTPPVSNISFKNQWEDLYKKEIEEFPGAYPTDNPIIYKNKIYNFCVYSTRNWNGSPQESNGSVMYLDTSTKKITNELKSGCITDYKTQYFKTTETVLYNDTVYIFGRYYKGSWNTGNGTFVTSGTPTQTVVKKYDLISKKFKPDLPTSTIDNNVTINNAAVANNQIVLFSRNNKVMILDPLTDTISKKQDVILSPYPPIILSYQNQNKILFVGGSGTSECKTIRYFDYDNFVISQSGSPDTKEDYCTEVKSGIIAGDELYLARSKSPLDTIVYDSYGNLMGVKLILSNTDKVNGVDDTTMEMLNLSDPNASYVYKTGSLYKSCSWDLLFNGNNIYCVGSATIPYWVLGFSASNDQIDNTTFDFEKYK